MNILAIETSCDETAIAILECEGGLEKPQFKVLAEEVSSQIETHRPFGGVVPNLAKREHIQNLPIVYEQVKSKLQNPNTKIDLVAVTVGPGLEPCLWTGINFAENLAKELNKPLIGVNHLEGHIYSNWLSPIRENPNNKIQNPNIEFPLIVLLVSGGHTMLILMTSLTEWKVLGETKDDAVGEAFDKVAKMLKLPYPGGPEIERLAQIANGQWHIANGTNSENHKLFAMSNKPIFPRPMIHEKNYNFSFSGLKTSVLYYLRDNPQSAIRNQEIENVCASFQKAAVDVLVTKTIRAAKEFNAKTILLCGGVASNKELQKELKIKANRLGINFSVPEQKYNGDNAVMIAAAAYMNHLQNKSHKIEANGNLGL